MSHLIHVLWAKPLMHDLWANPHIHVLLEAAFAST